MKLHALVTAALLLAAAAAQSAAYRWTDAQGQVHYTQTPPPQGDYRAVEPAAPPASAPAAAATPATGLSNDEFLKGRADDQARQAKQKADAARQQTTSAAQCEAARSRLQFLNDRPPTRIMVRDASGQPARMDAKDWEAERAKAQAEVDKGCR